MKNAESRSGLTSSCFKLLLYISMKLDYALVVAFCVQETLFEKLTKSKTDKYAFNSLCATCYIEVSLLWHQEYFCGQVNEALSKALNPELAHRA